MAPQIADESARVPHDYGCTRLVLIHASVPTHYTDGRAPMKNVILVIVAGCFLLGAAALHAYMTPVFGGGGPEGPVYMIRNGRVYMVTGLSLMWYNDGRIHISHLNGTEMGKEKGS